MSDDMHLPPSFSGFVQAGVELLKKGWEAISDVTGRVRTMVSDKWNEIRNNPKDAADIHQHTFTNDNPLFKETKKSPRELQTGAPPKADPKVPEARVGQPSAQATMQRPATNLNSAPKASSPSASPTIAGSTTSLDNAGTNRVPQYAAMARAAPTAVLAQNVPAAAGPAAAKISTGLQTATATTTEVRINREVLDKKCSDHSVVTYLCDDGPIISSNVMCSGEDYDPTKANSFLINPYEQKGRAERFDHMIAALASDAGKAFAQTGKHSVIALQEFPRKDETGTKEFTEKLKISFPNHTLVFGPKDDPKHPSSQLVLLVPNGVKVKKYFQNEVERAQVVIVGNKAYINVHPSPKPKNATDDVWQKKLNSLADKLLSEGYESVHIVGDWNRKQSELEASWSRVDTPAESSHLPPAGFDSKPNPIDHHVVRVKQTEPNPAQAIVPGPATHLGRVETTPTPQNAPAAPVTGGAEAVQAEDEEALSNPIDASLPSQFNARGRNGIDNNPRATLVRQMMGDHHDTYFHHVDKQGAEKLLQDKPVGTYIVWIEDKKNNPDMDGQVFKLSSKDRLGNVDHASFTILPDGKILNNSGFQYDNINAYIEGRRLGAPVIIKAKPQYVPTAQVVAPKADRTTENSRMADAALSAGVRQLEDENQPHTLPTAPSEYGGRALNYAKERVGEYSHPDVADMAAAEKILMSKGDKSYLFGPLKNNEGTLYVATMNSGKLTVKEIKFKILASGHIQIPSASQGDEKGKGYDDISQLLKANGAEKGMGKRAEVSRQTLATYYHPTLTRDQARGLIDNAGPGTFIIRNPTTPGSNKYTLEWNGKAGDETRRMGRTFTIDDNGVVTVPDYYDPTPENPELGPRSFLDMNEFMAVQQRESGLDMKKGITRDVKGLPAQNATAAQAAPAAAPAQKAAVLSAEELKANYLGEFKKIQAKLEEFGDRRNAILETYEGLSDDLKTEHEGLMAQLALDFERYEDNIVIENRIGRVAPNKEAQEKSLTFIKSRLELIESRLTAVEKVMASPGKVDSFVKVLEDIQLLIHDGRGKSAKIKDNNGAESVLKGLQVGAFLLWPAPDQVPNSYVISFNTDKGVQHKNIILKSQGGLRDGENEKSFDSFAAYLEERGLKGADGAYLPPQPKDSGTPNAPNVPILITDSVREKEKMPSIFSSIPQGFNGNPPKSYLILQGEKVGEYKLLVKTETGYNTHPFKINDNGKVIVQGLDRTLEVSDFAKFVNKQGGDPKLEISAKEDRIAASGDPRVAAGRQVAPHFVEIVGQPQLDAKLASMAPGTFFVWKAADAFAKEGGFVLTHKDDEGTINYIGFKITDNGRFLHVDENNVQTVYRTFQEMRNAVLS